MRVYGLTGNIGSGKSTVAQLFRERGVAVVDADLIAREVVEPGRPALAEVAARFPGVLRPEGALDRKALAARVFNDHAELAALNAIIHPRIAEETAKRMAALADQGAPFALYEAALIVENGLEEGFAGLIVVTSPAKEQMVRIMVRDGLDEAATRARLAAQLPADKKVAKADFVINNDGSLDALVPQVERILRGLRAGHRRMQ